MPGHEATYTFLNIFSENLLDNINKKYINLIYILLIPSVQNKVVPPKAQLQPPAVCPAAGNLQFNRESINIE